MYEWGLGIWEWVNTEDVQQGSGNICVGERGEREKVKRECEDLPSSLVLLSM